MASVFKDLNIEVTKKGMNHSSVTSPSRGIASGTSSESGLAGARPVAPVDVSGSGKTRMGIPDPGSPRGVVLASEARRSRHRLYPVTVVYTTGAVVTLLLALRSSAPVALLAASMGLAFWTLVEYLVHRYVLHGVFPARGSAWSRFLNKAFDHLHWQHHLRPWDGNHINGTIFDTLWVVGPVFALTLIAPLPTAPAFFAGFILGYVIEEWCHHSVHFYVLDWPWFRALKARHFYHHSRLGSQILFGLSNGFWDEVVGTGMPVQRPAPSSGVPATARMAPAVFRERPRPCPKPHSLWRSLSIPLGRPGGRRRSGRGCSSNQSEPPM